MDPNICPKIRVYKGIPIEKALITQTSSIWIWDENGITFVSYIWSTSFQWDSLRIALEMGAFAVGQRDCAMSHGILASHHGSSTEIAASHKQSHTSST